MDESFGGNQIAADAESNAARQQRKIIASFAYKNPAILNQEDVPEDLSCREQFYEDVNTGKIGTDQFKEMVERIQGPENRLGANGIFARLGDSKHMKRILAYATNIGFDNFENTNEVSIRHFLEIFPSPSDFDPVADDLIEAIERNNPQDKTDEYREAMSKFKKIVYGTKQEYWEQAKELERRAFLWDSKDKTNFYMKDAKILGDPWKQGDREYALTLDALSQAGLEPRHEVSIGGVNIGLSGAFMSGVRKSVIAYVRTENGTKVCAYYKANSTGLWRYMPDYVADQNGHIEWYGRGYAEESLTLPMEVQKMLNKIAAWDMVDFSKLGYEPNTAFFIAGTAKRYASRQEYEDALNGDSMRGDFYTEVDKAPVINYGEITSVKHPPESLSVEGGLEPNFRKIMNEYDTSNRLIGSYKIREFSSYDGSMNYIVCETREGGQRRAWIGGVELNSPVTSTGCKKEWASIGDLGTPLYAYTSMSGGYGDQENMRENGYYTSMWKNYLSRAPIIKQYIYSTDKNNTFIHVQ